MLVLDMTAMQLYGLLMLTVWNCVMCAAIGREMMRATDRKEQAVFLAVLVLVGAGPVFYGITALG